MITIKLPINLKNNEILNELRRIQSSIIRYSFNRFQECNKTVTEIESDVKSKFNLDSWFIRCGILEGKQLFTLFENKKIIFGGKFNLYKRLKGKITKEEYQQNRLLPLNIQGELNQNGNRKFELDIIDNNKIIFKPKHKEKIEIQLPKLRQNYKNKLYKLQESKQKYSIKLTDSYISISFEENNYQQFDLVENRSLSIDQNPNEIGVSILEFDTENNYKIIGTYKFDLSKLTVKSNESSNSKFSIYLQNKLRFETIQIVKRIWNISKSYNCKYIFVENLKFGTNFKSNNLNRLCKQKWLRTLFVEQLKKRSKIIGQKLLEVNPSYSSLIGNLQHNYIDSINSSIEIGRRGYLVRVKKQKKLYPRVNIKNSFLHLWKETEDGLINDWKIISERIKNLKVRYRVSLDECKYSYRVFRMNSIKSEVKLYNFI